MSRDKPVLRAIKLLSLIENNSNGLRVQDMAEQLGAPPRASLSGPGSSGRSSGPALYRQERQGKLWKIDPDYRNKLAIPFTLSELLSLYFAQDAIRPLDGTVLHDSLLSLFDKVRANLPKPLFRQMLELRGSFLSGIPAQKDYGTYREFIKVIEECIEGRKTLQLLYQPLNREPAERKSQSLRGSSPQRDTLSDRLLPHAEGHQVFRRGPDAEN